MSPFTTGKKIIVGVVLLAWPALAQALGRSDVLADPRFADAAKIAENAGALTAILDAAFGSHPMAHWAQALDAVAATHRQYQSRSSNVL